MKANQQIYILIIFKTFTFLKINKSTHTISIILKILKIFKVVFTCLDKVKEPTTT